MAYRYFLALAFVLQANGFGYCSPEHPRPLHTIVECRASGVPTKTQLIKFTPHCENGNLICEARCSGFLSQEKSYVPVCPENAYSLEYVSGCTPGRTEYSVRVVHSGLLASDCAPSEVLKKDSPSDACMKLREDGASLCRKKGEMQQTFRAQGECCIAAKP